MWYNLCTQTNTGGVHNDYCSSPRLTIIFFLVWNDKESRGWLKKFYCAHLCQWAPPFFPPFLSAPPPQTTLLIRPVAPSLVSKKEICPSLLTMSFYGNHFNNHCVIMRRNFAQLFFYLFISFSTLSSGISGALPPPFPVCTTKDRQRIQRAKPLSQWLCKLVSRLPDRARNNTFNESIPYFFFPVWSSSCSICLSHSVCSYID